MEVVTIVTSAGVGALVAAGLTFLNGHLGRRARRRELLLSKAVDLAHERIKIVLALAKEQKLDGELADASFLAVLYFKYLDSILEHGELPPDVKPDWEAWLERDKRRG